MSSLTALLPDGVTLALPVSPTMVAVSPDGRYIATTGASTPTIGGDRAGKYGVYLRAIDQNEFKPLAGAEFGYSPFFSDDGETLGCSVDINLWKVPVHGGQPTLITRSDWTHGASWRGNEVIFNLAPARDEGLRRIKADGSALGVVTKPDSSRGELNYFWPQILPGGNAVLFTVKVSGDHQKSRIVVESMKEKGRRVEIGEGAIGRYASTGHILYSQGGSLWAVPFDVTRLRVQGSARRVREGLMINPYFGAEMFDVSESDSGTLVYVPASAGAVGRQLVWMDRSNSNRPVNVPFPRGAIANVSLSPDGTRAAIAVGGTGADIWIYDLASEQRFKLIDDPRDDFVPKWSADAKWIYFCSDRLGIPDIFRQRADDRNSKTETVLVREGSQYCAPALHPNGKVTAFVDGNPSVTSDIMLLTLDPPSSEPEPFLSSSASEAGPVFSPDGKWLAYISDRNERGKFDVYVTSFPNKGPEIPVSAGEGVEPLWSPAGKELFYLSRDALMLVEVETTPTFRVVSRPRPLLIVPNVLRQVSGGSYDISPDGKRFLMIQEEPDQPALKRITVVQNWFVELKRLAPVEGKK